MIIDKITDFEFMPVFARVRGLIDSNVNVVLKIEGFNPGGSIKLKPALALVRDLEERGYLGEGCSLIETTSGNMGIALSLVARSKGYGFVCVCDEKITCHNKRLIEAYGAEIVMMPRSTLSERYAYITARTGKDTKLVWTRQFHNPLNPATHETTTAMEILNAFPRVDHLFVGVGTGGTLVGCSKVFARLSPHTRIVAVDAEGSRHFTENPTPVVRRIPGIGASERSPFINGIRVDKTVVASEERTVTACQMLLEHTGWLLGGSSGSVFSAVLDSQDEFSPGDTVVAVCADLGERYLDSVYSKEWAFRGLVMSQGD